MNNSKKIASNFIFKLLYQLVAIFSPLIITPYLARILGPTQLGNYGYTYSILIYFGLLAVFGFNIYGRREIAKVRDDKHLKSKVFYELMIAKALPSLIAIVLFVVLSLIYREYSTLLLCFLPALVYHILDITFLIQGDENFGFISLRDFLIKGSSIALIFIFVKSSSDVWKYALITSSTIFVSGLFTFPYLIKRILKVNIKELKIFHHYKKTAVFLVPAIASTVFLYIDKIMIKLITGSSDQVAFYEESIKIIVMLAGISTALADVIEPRNANENASGQQDVVKKNTLGGLSYSLLMCLPMMVGLLAVAPIFCPVFFGKGFELVVPVMQIMAVLIPIVAFNEMIGLTYLIPTNREKIYSNVILISAGANILLNMIFILFFGAIGAAISTVLSELLKSVILVVYLREEINIIDVLKNSWKKLASCVVMAIFVVPMVVLATSSISSLGAIVISGAALYASMIFFLKDNEFMNIIDFIIKPFKKLFAKLGKKK